jgi:tripartite-type tricarboxylate transporter receptor subunit TctC
MRTIAVPEVKSRLLAQGAEIIGIGPREFDKVLREEIARWAATIKRAGITPD